MNISQLGASNFAVSFGKNHYHQHELPPGLAKILRREFPDAKDFRKAEKALRDAAALNGAGINKEKAMAIVGQAGLLPVSQRIQVRQALHVRPPVLHSKRPA